MTNVGRTSTFDLYYDSGFFSPLQMQPHRVLALADMGWVRWMAEHIVPFPVMIREHQTAVVVTGLRLRYREPFGFLDGDHVTVATRIQLLGDRTVQGVTTDVTALSTNIATVDWTCRVLRITNHETLSATVGRIPDHLASRFDGAEPHARTAADPTTFVTRRLGEIVGSQAPLVNHDYDLTVGRALCEVADQWWFADIPTYLSAAREHLIEHHGDSHPILRQGLRRPLREMEIRLTRPFFLLDRATVTTSAFPGRVTPTFVHQIAGPSGAHHATAIETMDEE